MVNLYLSSSLGVVGAAVVDCRKGLLVTAELGTLVVAPEDDGAKVSPTRVGDAVGVMVSRVGIPVGGSVGASVEVGAKVIAIGSK